MAAETETNRLNVVWQPQEGSQRLFLECPFFETLYSGTRGPGKTDALLMSFAQYVGRGFGAAWRGIIFRRECPQLEDLIAKSKKWFHRIFPEAKFLGSDNKRKWVWPSGEELLFRHMDDPDDYWNYHGHEYPFEGWEELTNWPSADCYDSMKACCRSSHDDPAMPRMIRATCNPYGIGHGWVKKYFVDPAPAGVPIFNDKGQIRVRLHGTLRENKILLQADPGYVQNLESISDKNKRKAWLYGAWDITAGGMFDDLWLHRCHVLEPFALPKSWHVDRSFDWGSTKPYSCGHWAESDGTEAILPDGTRASFYPGSLIRIHDLYGWNGEENQGIRATNSEIARRIKETDEEIRKGYGVAVRPGPADNQIFDVVNGTSIHDEFAARGVRFVRSDKSPGSRRAGWQKMRDYLEAAKKRPMEGPGLFVFSTCRQFIRTVPALPRSPKNMDDVDTEAEDHIGDETRYRILHKRNYVSSEEIR